MDSSRNPKRRPLGRGLDALLPPSSAPSQPAATVHKTLQVPIEQLHPNRSQPRGRFDEQALEELAASIKELGVLEPLLVRRRSDGQYDIVAGERRWRAAQRAGVFKVPVFVRELTDKQSFEAALVENIQREDLNAIETARAFKRLMDEHDHTQESVAKRIGKSRSAVANSLRLLSLPEPVLERIEAEQISEGHGRALLGLADNAAITNLAELIVSQRLSVRDTEKQVRQALEQGSSGSGTSSSKNSKASKDSAPAASANVRDLESRLSRALGTKVSVQDKKGSGQIVIRYHDYDQLDGLIEALGA